MSNPSDADVYQVVVVPPRGCDKWPLTGRYVEFVWPEILGPTATLMARRLGHFIDAHPHGDELDYVAWARNLGVEPGRLRSAFGRLGRFGIANPALDQGVIGVSGLAPSLGPEQLLRIGAVARLEHDRQLDAGVPERPAERRRAGPAQAAQRLLRLAERPAVAAGAVKPAAGRLGRSPGRRRGFARRVGCLAPPCRVAPEGGVRASCAGRFPLYALLQVSLRETCRGGRGADGGEDGRAG